MYFSAPSQTGTPYFFLDLNSYFASVEQQENPQLRNKPVAVVPALTDTTCAIAASYEAKSFGIQTGTKIYDARKLCPDLHCVLARHDLYVDYHHRILSSIAGIVPIQTIWSIDEFSCRLPLLRQHISAAQSLAKQVKQAIWRNIGNSINCSIGLAPNSFLAKVASDMNKPNGLTTLEGKDLPGPLLDLHLMDLQGINQAMMRRLHNAGIQSIEHLWNIAPKHARAIWGSVSGERFWYNLHGYDVPSSAPHSTTDTANIPTTIGHSRVLDPKFRNPHQAKAMGIRLVAKACQRLRQNNLYASGFTLSIRTCANIKWSRDIRMRHVQDTSSFIHVFNRLWDKMVAEEQPRFLKKISVSLHRIAPPETTTRDLFDQPSEQGNNDRHQSTSYAKNKAISQAMDQLNEKFGADTIHIGMPPKTFSGHIGTKIAFSRVPDVKEFH